MFPVKGGYVAAAVIFLIAASVVFFGRFVGVSPAGYVRIPPGDLSSQFYPFHAYYASEMWAGRLPLWNPYIFAGHPFLANPQINGFYPLTVLTTFVFGNPGLSPESLLWQIVGDGILAALFTYLFVKQLTGSRFGAVLAAIMFSTGGYLTSYPIQQMSILETAIWLPLVLFFVERGVASSWCEMASTPPPHPGRTGTSAPTPCTSHQKPTGNTQSIGSFLLAGIALAISYLAGHPQIAMVITYAALLYTLLRAVMERASWKRTALGVTALLGIGLGLSAIQVLPALELASLSARTRMGFEAVNQGYDFGSLMGMLIPGWRDESALYIGAATPGLVPLALLRGRRRRFLATVVVGLFGLALSLGGNIPLFQLLYALAPGFSLFRDQERAVFVFSLAASVLVGGGCAQMLRDDVSRRSQITAASCGAMVALIVASAGLLIARSGLGAQIGLDSNSYDRVAASYVFFAITLAVAGLLVVTGSIGKPAISRHEMSGVPRPTTGGQRRPPLRIPILHEKLASFRCKTEATRRVPAQGEETSPLRCSNSHHELASSWREMAATPPPRPGRTGPSAPTDSTLHQKLARKLAAILLVVLVTVDTFAINWERNAGTESFQIDSEAASAISFLQAQEGIYRVRIEDDKVLPANYPALFGLQHVTGDAPLQEARVHDLLREAGEWKLWQLFNVRYVLTRRAFDEGVKLAYETGGLRVFEMMYGLPRAYAVRRYVVARDAQEEMDLTISPATVPGDTVVLAAPPSLSPTFTVQERPEVDVMAYEPQYLRIGTDGADDSILVVSDAFYPWWKTYVDGIPVPTLRANYAFRAIELPRGRHVVEMVLEPTSFWFGFAVSGLTLLFLVGFGATRMLRSAMANT